MKTKRIEKWVNSLVLSLSDCLKHIGTTCLGDTRRYLTMRNGRPCLPSALLGPSPCGDEAENAQFADFESRSRRDVSQLG